MQDCKLKSSEADLMRAIKDYLTYCQNAGKLYFDRLNAGRIIALKGGKPYNVELCREGTADFIVLQKLKLLGGISSTRVIFLEVKSLKGKQRPEQGAFQKLVEEQGCSYHIVRSVEEVMEILK